MKKTKPAQSASARLPIAVSHPWRDFFENRRSLKDAARMVGKL
jgi:hypothetical protein